MPDAISFLSYDKYQNSGLQTRGSVSASQKNLHINLYTQNPAEQKEYQIKWRKKLKISLEAIETEARRAAESRNHDSHYFPKNAKRPTVTPTALLLRLLLFEEHLKAADSNEDMQIKGARSSTSTRSRSHSQRQCGKITMSITRHIKRSHRGVPLSPVKSSSRGHNGIGQR